MRYFILFSVIALMLLSCDNSKRNSLKIETPPNTTSTVSSQNVQEEDIPYGYTKQSYQEYVPLNAAEKNLVHYLHEYSNAMEARDAKRLVKLINPDYAVLIQKKIPNTTVKEIREKLPLLYEKSIEEFIARFTKDWDKAENGSSRITNIINRVREGNKLLYLYEYHSMLYNKTDTIYKIEKEYSVISSIDNGKTWYATTNNMDEVYEMLGLRFKKSSIDEVFTKH